ncbi:MAG: CoA transferase [Polyangiaceae bacterium]|jgi:crotonobetainyl-CoA:carnitine CoA-transferase CaiB-like acyl-CoA transferase|nr:CoA transferase [Polyangiaceae bacterium]
MSDRPLSAIKVLEFTHAVMGPSCGVILADLGAEVIHIEPPEGDSTRRLKGFGTGYFTYFNRNKKSLAVDIKSPPGRELILSLIGKADALVENFGPGTMDRIGYGYDVARKLNPRLVYCSLKGFNEGPYEQRPAMDEVVQIMGGLAYMTGPSGHPMRAGTSIVDITGGMFGAIAILAALRQREQTGQGQLVRAALFETTAFLMGQHMAYSAISKETVPPMPERVSAWSVYRTFESSDNEIVFIGLVSDKHWQRFCDKFERNDLFADRRLTTNNDRIRERNWLLPDLEQTLRRMTKAQIIERCEAANIPFAPVARPEDLFDDPQLNYGPGMLQTRLPGGDTVKLPRLPLCMEDVDLGLYRQPPVIGNDTRAILQDLGLHASQIDELVRQKVVVCSDDMTA